VLWPFAPEIDVMHAHRSPRSSWSPDRLQERLLVFATEVCRLVADLQPNLVSGHIAGQLVRSGSAPAANYAEARAAESPRDFAHKMGICLKELRETRVWFDLLQRLDPGVSIRDLAQECDELTAIFVTSINTARRRLMPG
jgi:four helix bundle protein